MSDFQISGFSLMNLLREIAPFFKQKIEKSINFRKKIKNSSFSTLQTLVTYKTLFWYLPQISRNKMMKISDFQIFGFSLINLLRGNSWFTVFFKWKVEKSIDFHKKIKNASYSALQTLVKTKTLFWYLPQISRNKIMKISDFQIFGFSLINLIREKFPY